jgi:hypothetical protein
VAWGTALHRVVFPSGERCIFENVAVQRAQCSGLGKPLQSENLPSGERCISQNSGLGQSGALVSVLGGKQTLRKALVVVLKPDREARPLAIGALTRAQRSAQLLCERSDDAHAQAATNRIGVEVWG